MIGVTTAVSVASVASVDCLLCAFFSRAISAMMRAGSNDGDLQMQDYLDTYANGDTYLTVPAEARLKWYDKRPDWHFRLTDYSFVTLGSSISSDDRNFWAVGEHYYYSA